MKPYGVLVLCLFLSSCSTGFNGSGSYNKQLYSYNEILIVNHSRELIQDASITAGAIGRHFSCGNIAPGGICADKFPSRPYMRSPIQIAWTFGNTARQTREFVLEVPSTFSIELPIRGVLKISSDGTISAYFEQD